MTSPIYIVEQAVGQFLQHWFNGLQPSLSLSTNLNGTICVKSEVVSLTHNNIDFKPVTPYFPDQGCKRSGRKAILHRRIRGPSQRRILDPPSKSV